MCVLYALVYSNYTIWIRIYKMKLPIFLSITARKWAFHSKCHNPPNSLWLMISRPSAIWWQRNAYHLFFKRAQIIVDIREYDGLIQRDHIVVLSVSHIYDEPIFWWSVVLPLYLIVLYLYQNQYSLHGQQISSSEASLELQKCCWHDMTNKTNQHRGCRR